MGIRIGIGRLKIGTQAGSYWTTQEEHIIEIQPDAAISKDTSIYNSAPTKNRGAYITLSIGEVNVGAFSCRSLIQFDLSSLPNDAIITSCRLHFTIEHNYATNLRDFKLYRMKRSWVEGTGTDTISGDGATWNTYNGVNGWTSPGAFDPADCEQIPIGVSHMAISPIYRSSIDFTISAKSKSELDLGYGWLIKADIEDNDAHVFYSSDNVSNNKYNPSLFISYILPNAGNAYTFARSEYNPLLSNVWFGSIWYNGIGDYVAYYSDATNVLRATSPDGLIWTPDAVNNPVMTPIAGAIEVVSIWKEMIWYMLYRSTEWGGGLTSIGLATSNDGITWVKEGTNPVITGDVTKWYGRHIDPWGVIKIGSVYYLWINDVTQTPRQSGLVTSTDLINWTHDPNNPIFDNNRYCATPIKYNGYYYLFICYTPNGTYDLGATNHRIELYKDSDPRFLPTSRKYLGYILTGGGLGSWENSYLDTPNILTNDIKRDSFPTSLLWMYYLGYKDTGMDAVGWSIGLALGDFDIIKKLRAKTEP